jgi:hypothetical protein
MKKGTPFLLSYLIFIASVLMGCTPKDPFAKVKFTAMDMREFQQDLQVPKALWKAMESVYRPMALDAEGLALKEDQKKDEDEGSAELLKKRPPLDQIPFHLYLVEKTSGVLGGQSYDLKYPVGGGILDYRGFVPETKDGTFFMKVDFAKEMDPKEMRVFYLSNAKIRQLGDKPLGNGCGRYFDITDYWKNAMKGEGLVLNTSGNRHISITAGTLFFVAPVMGKLRIAHLLIKDPRHRDLHCDGGIDSK